MIGTVESPPAVDLEWLIVKPESKVSVQFLVKGPGLTNHMKNEKKTSQ